MPYNMYAKGHLWQDYYTWIETPLSTKNIKGLIQPTSETIWYDSKYIAEKLNKKNYKKDIKKYVDEKDVRKYKEFETRYTGWRNFLKRNRKFLSEKGVQNFIWETIPK